MALDLGGDEEDDAVAPPAGGGNQIGHAGRRAIQVAGFISSAAKEPRQAASPDAPTWETETWADSKAFDRLYENGEVPVTGLRAAFDAGLITRSEMEYAMSGMSEDSERTRLERLLMYKDHRGGWGGMLENFGGLLSTVSGARFMAASSSAILQGLKDDKLGVGGFGLAWSTEEFTRAWTSRTYWQDVFAAGGVDPGEGIMSAGFARGLTADILLDPATYLTFGVSAAAKVAIKGNTKAAATLARNMAAKGIKGADEIAKGGNVTLTRHGEEIFKIAGRHIINQSNQSKRLIEMAKQGGQKAFFWSKDKKAVGRSDSLLDEVYEQFGVNADNVAPEHVMRMMELPEFRGKMTEFVIDNYERFAIEKLDLMRGGAGDGLFNKARSVAKGDIWTPKGIAARGNLQRGPISMFNETNGFWGKERGLPTDKLMGSLSEGLDDINALAIAKVQEKTMNPMLVAATKATGWASGQARGYIEGARNWFTAAVERLPMEERLGMQAIFDAADAEMTKSSVRIREMFDQTLNYTTSTGQKISRKLEKVDREMISKNMEMPDLYPLSDELVPFRDFAAKEFDRLHELEDALGVAGHKIDDYVAHFYGGKAFGRRMLMLKDLKSPSGQVAARIGSASVRVDANFALHRKIATLDDAVAWFGKEHVELDIANILARRSFVSARVRAKQSARIAMVEKHGIGGLTTSLTMEGKAFGKLLRGAGYVRSWVDTGGHQPIKKAQIDQIDHLLLQVAQIDIKRLAKNSRKDVAQKRRVPESVKKDKATGKRTQTKDGVETNWFESAPNVEAKKKSTLVRIKRAKRRNQQKLRQVTRGLFGKKNLSDLTEGEADFLHDMIQGFLNPTTMVDRQGNIISKGFKRGGRGLVIAKIESGLVRNDGIAFGRASGGKFDNVNWKTRHAAGQKIRQIKRELKDLEDAKAPAESGGMSRSDWQEAWDHAIHSGAKQEQIDELLRKRDLPEPETGAPVDNSARIQELEMELSAQKEIARGERGMQGSDRLVPIDDAIPIDQRRTAISILKKRGVEPEDALDAKMSMPHDLDIRSNRRVAFKLRKQVYNALGYRFKSFTDKHPDLDVSVQDIVDMTDDGIRALAKKVRGLQDDADIVKRLDRSASLREGASSYGERLAKEPHQIEHAIFEDLRQGVDAYRRFFNMDKGGPDSYSGSGASGGLMDKRDLEDMIAGTVRNRDVPNNGKEVAEALALVADDPALVIVLNKIMPHLEDVNVRIANDPKTAMREFGDKGTLGLSRRTNDGKTRDVWIRGTRTPGSDGVNANIIGHELVHAATQNRVQVARLKTNKDSELQEAWKGINSLLSEKVMPAWKERGREFLARMKDGRVSRDENFPLEMNVDEFIAWGLTHKGFQDFLSEIKVDGGKATLFTKFTEYIAQLLGVGGKGKTALTEMLRLTEDLLDAPIGKLDKAMKKGGEDVLLGAKPKIGRKPQYSDRQIREVLDEVSGQRVKKGQSLGRMERGSIARATKSLMDDAAGLRKEAGKLMREAGPGARAAVRKARSAVDSLAGKARKLKKEVDKINKAELRQVKWAEAKLKVAVPKVDRTKARIVTLKAKEFGPKAVKGQEKNKLAIERAEKLLKKQEGAVTDQRTRIDNASKDADALRVEASDKMSATHKSLIEARKDLADLGTREAKANLASELRGKRREKLAEVEGLKGKHKKLTAEIEGTMKDISGTYILPKDMVNAIDELSGSGFDFSNPIHRGLRFWQDFQKIWKTPLTLPFPEHHFRNAITNVGLTSTRLGFRMLNPQIWRVSANVCGYLLFQTAATSFSHGRRMMPKAMVKGLERAAAHAKKEWNSVEMTTVDGRTLTIADIAKAALNRGINHGFVHSELGFTPYQQFDKAAAGRLTAPLKFVWDQTKGVMKKGAVATEQVFDVPFRLAMFTDEVLNGSSFDESAEVVRTFLNDWSRMSDKEKVYMRTGMPFYSWFQFSLERAFKDAVNTPGKFMLPFKTVQAAHNSMPKDMPPPKWVPQYISERLGIWEAPNEHGYYSKLVGFGLNQEEALRQFLAMKDFASIIAHEGLSILSEDLATGLAPPPRAEEAGLRVLAQMDFVAKGVAEYMRGKQFFDNQKTGTNAELLLLGRSRLESGRGFEDLDKGLIHGAKTHGALGAVVQGLGGEWLKDWLEYLPPGDSGFGGARVSAYKRWLLGQSPVGRFVQTYQQRVKAKAMGEVNYKMVALHTLGADIYRFHPNEGKYYRDKARIQGVAILMRQAHAIERGTYYFNTGLRAEDADPVTERALERLKLDIDASPRIDRATEKINLSD